MSSHARLPEGHSVESGLNVMDRRSVNAASHKLRKL
jgi:hypothetical protein